MITDKALAQHIMSNAGRIETEVKQYAKSYNVTLEKARTDVIDEWKAAFYQDVETVRDYQ